MAVALLLVLATTKAAPTPEGIRRIDNTLDDFRLQLCGDMNSTTIIHGTYVEVECNRNNSIHTPVDDEEHEIQTFLWIHTDEGSYGVNAGFDAANHGMLLSNGKPLTFNNYQYGGGIATSSGMVRGIYLNAFSDALDARVLETTPRVCTHDSHFCFDLRNYACHFYAASRLWTEQCLGLPVLKKKVLHSDSFPGFGL
ncbi:hypothetical protein EMPS_08152 [Entomortierella parvispora]|uniref:Uncharacterized protein n=1 Tax=Entomortierella parvispora TaxID=205924 RepID=A0A9P3HFL8_9FUNG|nr:hypothetical protein EMPS_08152 [Entomortierella parvispora]